MERTFAEMRDARVSSGRSWLCTLLLVACCLTPAAWAEEGPRSEVEQALRAGLAILGDPGLQEEAKIERVRAVFLPLFDFPEMARRSLGSHWRRRTPEEREEFTRLFGALLEKTYTSRIAAFRTQRVHFTGEEIDGRYAQVDTRIMDREGRRFELDYRMHRVEATGKWLIYDIVIQDISLVNNYRAQFNRVINRRSYESLVAKLRAQ